MSGALQFLLQHRLIDLILAGVALEACVLLAYRRASGRGVPVRLLLANLVSGASLMLAVRLALGGAAEAAWIPALLLIALVAHLADLVARWQGMPAGLPARRGGR